MAFIPIIDPIDIYGGIWREIINGGNKYLQTRASLKETDQCRYVTRVTPLNNFQTSDEIWTGMRPRDGAGPTQDGILKLESRRPL